MLRLWASGWLESWWEGNPTGNSLWKEAQQEKSNEEFSFHNENRFVTEQKLGFFVESAFNPFNVTTHNSCVVSSRRVKQRRTRMSF